MAGRRQFLLDNVPNRVSHSARCNVVIVNTADAEVPEPPPPPPVEGQLLHRARRIARVLARFARDARRTDSNAERAQLLRGALEELGPTFSKLGQILSTRPDLLPPEVVEELALLQSTVTPLSEEEVVRVMEQELRVPWEDVFASIDPEPLAAGTIGQVHTATLETGERVVVKVQRPNAEQDILRDLGLLELLAEKAQQREGLRGTIDIPALVLHLSDSLRRELDFREEAANIDRMREVLAPYDRLGVPRVYHELSTSRLLVIEYVEGVPSRGHPTARSAARRPGSCSRPSTGSCSPTASSTPIRIPATCSGGGRREDLPARPRHGRRARPRAARADAPAAARVLAQRRRASSPRRC